MNPSVHNKPKVIRSATIALSLDYLLKGQLSFLNRNYDVLAVSGMDVHLKTVAEREGVSVYDLEMQRAISPIKDLVSLIRLYKLFRAERPAIVHSITPKAGLLSMLAAKAAGVPVRIHTFTGLIFPSKTGVLQRILILMDRILCRAATHIIPEGQGVLQDLQSYHITSKPMQVLANGNVNGIDTVYFAPEAVSDAVRQQYRREMEIGENDFVFVFVGRLVRDKGITELIAAFNQLAERYDHIKLLLVGPYEQELDPLPAATIAMIEQHSQVITVGFQKDVRPYLAISHALAFPSYREGFPNVVLQAGAMGLPTVATNINGCNEIIVDGKNGILIPPKDVDALAAAMQRLCDDPEYYDALDQQSRPMIVSRYRQEMVWAAVAALYDNLLS